MKMKLTKLPIMGSIFALIYKYFNILFFKSSEQYWINRYKMGGNSGFGSYNKLAEFKADVLNDFVQKEGIQSVIEFGSGDGNQLKYLNYPRYIGLDISFEALDMCKKKFIDDTTKSFKHITEYDGEKADLALSLDVIFHLTEDNAYEDYMNLLFSSAERFVIIYSSNSSKQIKRQGSHITQREFSTWVDKNKHNWELAKHIPNRYPFNGNPKEGSFSDFYIYKKVSTV